ncbi:hypothetical protein [Pseudofrankia sp. BMG5.36]|uniref:hypothetical protein n=1 Tax=Pseudofrankia sp. BMG5.36 TaxID=1834512 RepID=UPI0012FFAD05|nr:hypothetical protein [Pseudofrankia sp. BMG5.36]
MARYRCGDCGAVSDNVTTQAEADELLATHQRYFCRPAQPTRDTSAQPAPQRARR